MSSAEAESEESLWRVGGYALQYANRGPLLTPGRHVVAFSCGPAENWSGDWPFSWNGSK